jgi:hypothetical protein
VSKGPAALIAVTAPLWYGTVAGLLGMVPWRWVVGLGLAIPYVLGPILVRALTKWPAHPEIEPYDPKDETPPAQIGSFFADVEAALAREGYRPDVWLIQRGLVQHTVSRMRVFWNEREEAAAIAYAIISDDPRASQFVSYIDVITYRRDGRHRLTNNAPRPSPYPPMPQRELEMFPQVRDPARLARLHRALCARDGRPAPLPDEFRRDPMRYGADAIRRELMSQVTTGYLALDEMGEHLRPTLRGAALMTWKMLPPSSWIIAWQIRRRAASLLALLDRAGRDERPLSTPADRSSGSPSMLPLTSAAAVLIVVAILRLPELFGGVSLAPPGMRDESYPMPQDFAPASEYAEAVRQLEMLADTRGEPLRALADDGRVVTTSGVSIPMRSTLVASFLAQVRPLFLAHGFYVFRAEQSFGIAGEPDRIAILPTADQLEVVRTMGTSAPNYDIANHDIVAWLRALHTEHPFTITGAGTDWIAARFAAPPRDAMMLARRINSFCPDVVEQGAGSVSALAEEIEKTRQLYCWWD